MCVSVFDSLCMCVGGWGVAADRELADVLLAAGDLGGNTHPHTKLNQHPPSSFTPVPQQACLPKSLEPLLAGREECVCVCVGGGVFNDRVAGCP